MPRPSVEPQRRSALLAATIAEIGQTGSLDVTVGRIAARAGMSTALAHHYFGSKDNILLAAMRAVLTAYGTGVRDRLRGVADPRARLDAIVAASFAPENFGPETVAAWLNFYVLARTSAPAHRLLTIYHRRLHANLIHALRGLPGVDAAAAAEQVAALIDGLYLRQALARSEVAGDAAIATVARFLDALTTAPEPGR